MEKGKLSTFDRYFGFLPKHPAAIVFFVFFVLYYLCGMFLWTKVGVDIMMFGWWPFPHFIYCFGYVPIFTAALVTYYYKFWPELKNIEKEDQSA